MYVDISDETSLARARAHVTSVLTGLRAGMQRGRAVRYTVSPHTESGMSLDISTEAPALDVRLCASSDGELWFATGSVQFDTTHGAACGAASIEATSSDEDLAAIAADLVSQIEDQLAFLG